MGRFESRPGAHGVTRPTVPWAGEPAGEMARENLGMRSVERGPKVGLVCCGPTRLRLRAECGVRSALNSRPHGLELVSNPQHTIVNFISKNIIPLEWGGFTSRMGENRAAGWEAGLPRFFQCGCLVRVQRGRSWY